MKKFWVLLFCAAALLISIGIASDVKSGSIRYLMSNQDEMTRMAQAAVTKTDIQWKYGKRPPEYVHQWNVTVFQVRYSGFGSQSRECGLYYSQEDVFHGLGNERDAVELENGMQFLGDGDNWTKVEKLADRWYWYERHW